MKNFIGKLFCFITILLVTSNVAFSFGSTHTITKIAFHKKHERVVVQKHKEIHTDDQSNVHYDFLIEEDTFENDDVEDLEILSDFPDSYSFHFTLQLKRSVLRINHKPCNVAIVKVPRWLLVRHIII